MKLKALLVDDEINILRNLQLVLPWYDYDVEIVGTAKNGVEALALVKEHHPHLMFCDIRMPVMDGIAFLKELRTFNDTTEVIMLTGYQEFEYARSVLRYQVLDYVLKPIDYDALELLFIQSVQTIREKLQKTVKEEETKEKLIDIAYEKMFIDIVKGYADTVQIEKWKSFFQLNEKQCLMFGISCENAVLPNEFMAQFTPLIDSLGEEQQSYFIQVDNQLWTIVVVGTYRSFKVNNLEHVMKGLDEALQIDCHVAVFNQPLKLDELELCWKRLEKELSMEQSKFLVLDYCPTVVETTSEQAIWQCVEQLITAAKNMDRQKAKDIVSQLEQQVRQFSAISINHIEKLVNSALIYFIKELRKYDAIEAEIETTLFDQLSRKMKIKDMIKVFNQLVDETINDRLHKRPQSSIQTANKYIEEYLSTDINAEDVANYLNISPSYFSTLFKQHYGMNFIEYVTQARIERAQSLLLMTNKSISDIAKTVGYLDRRYFNKVFQKKVGILPSEYREQNKVETG